ncbi:hypothetical protein LK09_10090 [Microbacterium mangrovi]|uniref:IclR family transcriptional regulator n=2 Tax=Microbacterium mangrovi TaxID=1348253 RepID=A0A0B2A8H8_9MICO|nr:hypothetical protein LK09_10090 [Microbacterium mangrovi]
MSMVMDANETDASDAVRRRQPLARGIELLTHMVESPQDAHGVRELAGVLDVSPSTAHRLITDLEKIGMVRRTENGTSYRLGLDFLRLAWLASSRYPMHDISENLLRDLVARTGESAFSCLYNEQRRSMMFTMSVESSHPLQYALPLQKWLPLHGGASGLAIFAELPDARREALAHSGLEPITVNTVTDPDAVLARLTDIHAAGYAITHGERIEGAVAIAAPTFGPAGEVVGSVGLSIPEARFDEARTAAFAEAVRTTAAQFTARIQGSNRSS